MPDRPPLTLLEFIGCCFEKNELLDGALWRWNVYETVELAEQQGDALIQEGIALLGAPQHNIVEGGLHDMRWPTLRLMRRGLAVFIAIPVRVKDAYFAHHNSPAETWKRAGDDLSALYERAER